MQLRKKTILLTTLVSALSLALLCPGCGEDRKGGGGGGGEGEGEGEGQQQKENKVDAQVEEEGGQTQHETNTQAQPSEQFGAAIADQVLHLYFLSNAGTIWTFTVDTAENPIPASLPVGQQDDAVFGTYTSIAGGVPVALATNGTGRLVIDTCPAAVGDLVTGRFQGIVFAGESQPSRTMDGTFKLVVRTGSGELNCIPAEGEGEGEGGGEGEGEGGGACDYALCADPQAHCCPYMECMGSCVFNCISDCMAGWERCMQCMPNCWESTCGVSAQCKTAATALWNCQESSGCQNEDEEQEEACTRAHCCDELRAAY